MNAKRTLSSLILFGVSAGNVLAEEPSTVHHPWSMSYNPLRYFKSLTTREAVVGEFVAMLPGSTRDQVRSELGEAIRYPGRSRSLKHAGVSEMPASIRP